MSIMRRSKDATRGVRLMCKQPNRSKTVFAVRPRTTNSAGAASGRLGAAEGVFRRPARGTLVLKPSAAPSLPTTFMKNVGAGCAKLDRQPIVGHDNSLHPRRMRESTLGGHASYTRRSYNTSTSGAVSGSPHVLGSPSVLD
eukprot:COSAG01_NODE_39741_length_472_cov_3.308311_1_plen_140_part_01